MIRMKAHVRTFNYYIYLLILIQKIKCTFIAMFYQNLDKNFNTPSSFTIKIAITTVLGIFVGFFGIRCFRISFFIISLILIDTFLEKYIGKISSYLEKSSVPSIFTKQFNLIFSNNIRDSQVKVFIVILLLSLLISVIINHLIKVLKYIVMISLFIHIYIKDYHRLYSEYFGFSNEDVLISYLMLFIMYFIVFIVCKKGTDYIFGCFFGFMGPLIFVTGLDICSEKKLGFIKTLTKWDESSLREMNLKYLLPFVLVCGVCTTIQTYYVVTSKKEIF
ncbi:hypothetical protein EDEG_02565 [Edhazardia aedis USNM 41457]|uniref:Uncharacterized protein n=1 Tax=Edhazardia aedis (strain USNM 41457) TaxID=1003232 RepID=J9D5L3_EDHAE|nr:hypothetical protein EDEG_02565 [Edhazardia aedis USNM 41457]|eukprot:EJW03046.2 hypothetical protein EDEG_02565 [Edhazardia aedis USNM 41457]